MRDPGGTSVLLAVGGGLAIAGLELVLKHGLVQPAESHALHCSLCYSLFFVSDWLAELGASLFAAPLGQCRLFIP